MTEKTTETKREQEEKIVTLPIGFQKKMRTFLMKMKKSYPIKFSDISSANACFVINKYTEESLELILDYQDKLLGIPKKEF